jgi:cytochrome oxidase Cu insertion factor (SCO1/SenC/PrrC family)
MSGTKSSAPAFAGTPAEGLAFTVHSLPDAALADTERRTRSGRIKMLLVLLVCASPVIASYLAFFFYRPDTGVNYSELIVPPRPLPSAAALPLADLQGRAVDPAALKGQWLLVVVDSGACAEACEQRLFMQRQLREMNGRDRDRIDKLWLVIDDAPVKPALQQALAGTPGMHMLRVPRATVAPG